ncbi:amino acid adenylation domain-containing protein [Clostridiaceae bacterium M8S5]|nr:amino acid adenylation domain-containing protein [Clostridiaceae bacterium M8S5]
MDVQKLLINCFRYNKSTIEVKDKNQVTKLTYKQLEERITALATLLYENGIKPNDYVILQMNSSKHYLIAVLTLFYMRAIPMAVPISNNIEQFGRLKKIKSEVPSAVILTDTDGNEYIKLYDENNDLKTITLNEQDFNLKWTDKKRYNIQIDENVSDEDVVIVQYSSGTTSSPKGIMLTHRGFLNNLKGFSDAINSDTDDIWMTWMPLTHVSGLFYLMIPLYNDSDTTFLETSEFLKSPKSWFDELERVKATVTIGPNFAFGYLTKMIDEHDIWDLSNVRVIINGSEPVSKGIIDGFVKQMDRFKLKQDVIYPAYGLTEATLLCTLNTSILEDKPVNFERVVSKIDFDVEDINHLKEDLTSIGPAIKGVTLRIVDNEYNELEEYQIGNIQVGGFSLCKGYLGRDDSELFYNEWINTGDIGFTVDGNLYIVGRKKDMVFVNGKNIFLMDIEHAIKERFKVRNAVCGEHIASEGKANIYVFIEMDVDKEKYEEIKNEIRQFILKDTSILVKEVVFMDKLKTTRTGKINKPSLLKWYKQKITNSYENKDIVLKKLEGIFDDKLEVNMSIFNIMEDSINMFQKIAKINKQFDIEIEMLDIAKCSTIKDLVDRICSKIKNEKKYIEKSNITNKQIINQMMPLTKIQEAYYIGREQEFCGGFNSTHFYAEIQHDMDIERLEQCMNKLIERHEMLRTVFIDSKQKVLTINQVGKYSLEMLSITKDRADDFIKTMREESQKNITDPEKWPLFKATNVKVDNNNILIIDIDMLIVDGMSIKILINDFLKLYNEEELEPVTTSYKDYIDCIMNEKTSRKYNRDKEYWINKIKDIPESPKLPLKHNIENNENIYSRIKHDFTADEYDKLENFTRENGVTVSSLLCFLYMKILSRWSENQDLTINITIFDRHKIKDSHKIIGDFTSSVLFDYKSSDYKNDILSNVKKVREKLYEYLDHNSFEGTEVIRELSRHRAEHAESQMPVVFTSMLFEEGIDFMSLGEILYGQSQTSQVYLDNQIIKLKKGFVIRWDYLEKCFNLDILKDMFTYYIESIKNIINKDISDVKISSSKAFVDYNNTKVSFKQAQTLDCLIIEALDKYRHKNAMYDNGKYITYEELKDSIYRISSQLDAMGIKKGDYITVRANKSIESISVLIAVVVIGAVYIPVPMDYPQDRIQFIMNNSKSKLLINSIKVFDDAKSKTPLFNIKKECNKEDSAYIIYTSGSTGVPKGVEITHEAVVNTLLDINDRFSIDSKDKIIGISALNFDLSVYDIFGTIIAGGCLAIVKDQRDTSHIQTVLDFTKSSVWNTVPAIMELFLEGVEIGYINRNLKKILLSGDWIDLKLPQKIKNSFPNAEIYSLGGATEGSIWSIYYPIKEVKLEWKSIPYGYPLANQNIYILNSELQLCPYGVAGEIYIGGKGVAKRYIGNKQKSREAFIDTEKFGRIYRTGDYGVFSREGYVTFLGRKDSQVKVRGHRIELSEIELNLNKLSFIKESIVILDDSKKIIAYYTGEEESDKAIKGALMNFLPEYMIPNQYVCIKEIPLSENGKIARDKLPKTSIKKRETKLPNSDIQQRIIKIWKEVLDIDDLGIDDDFFELGGDSLSAQKIVQKIKKEFKEKISINAIIKKGTARKLSELLQKNDQVIINKTNNLLTLKQLFDIQDERYSSIGGRRIEYGSDEYYKYKEEMSLRHNKNNKDLIMLNQSEEYPDYMEKRRSIREFDKNTKVSYSVFCDVLSSFRQKDDKDQRRCYYPSSGGLYAIDVYVHVKKNRIEGINQGMYLYNSHENGLKLINNQVDLPSNVHFYSNRDIFDSSAFSVFFVYDTKCNMPVYGGMGNFNALIDTGFMAYQLALVGQMKGLGSCSIGDMNFDEVLKLYNLSQDNMILHAVEMGIEKCTLEKEQYPQSEIQRAYLNGRNEGFELGKYDAHYYLEIETKYDTNLIEHSINELIKRHDILKTVFLTNGMQEVTRQVPYYKVKLTDVSEKDEIEKQEAVDRIRQKLSHKRYTNDKWPLFTFEFAKTENDKGILFISMNLMICDGASFHIIIKELSELLDNKFDSEQLRYSFGEYTRSLEKLKDSSEYIKAKEYWLEKIKSFSEYPKLPMKQKLSSLKDYSLKRKSGVIKSDVWKRVKDYVKKKRISPSATLCTIFSKLLSIWSNQAELILNLTVFQRLDFNEQVDEIVGDFTKLIPLNVNLDSKDFIDCAKDTQENILSGVDNIAFDGVEVIRELSRQTQSIGKAVLPVVFTSMLFDTKVNYFNRIGKIKYAVSQTPQVFLDCQVMELEGELHISWDYVDELFDSDMISQMFGQFLEMISKANNEKEMLTDIKTDSLELWNKYNHIIKPAKPLTMHEMFIKQVAKTPKAIAIAFEGEKYTYEDIDKKSNQVARYILDNGISEKARVGVIGFRRPETIISILGILKAGGIYVPIDPKYPKDRIEYILRDSSCEMYLDLEIYSCLTLDKYNNDKVNVKYDPDSMAYIIYTSGSTGKPKGVMIEHKAVCNTIEDINEKISLSQDDCIIGISSVCFDLSVYDIFGALSTGAKLAIIKDPRDSGEILRVIKDEGVTIWNTVPIIMTMLTSYMEKRNIEKITTLREVMLSGDWIPVELPANIKDKFPNSFTTSLGGATEGSIWSIYYPIKEIRDEWSSIPYGMPLKNQAMYVLNYEKELCSAGVKGDIYIGGVGLAKGYNNDEEKTKKAFINHPQLGMIYRTGDIGVYNKEGYIEFLGRADNQVKIRGYRVELGEIETVLSKNNDIKEAVVLMSKENKQLIGYVVTKGSIKDENIKDYLNKKLPDYMVPVHIVMLDELPRTVNGKVDKKNLPSIKIEDSKDKNYKKPITKLQKELVEIWENLFEMTPIGIDEDFFTLGGDSITLMKMIEEINRITGVDVSIDDLLNYKTIENIALKIS